MRSNEHVDLTSFSRSPASFFFGGFRRFHALWSLLYLKTQASPWCHPSKKAAQDFPPSRSIHQAGEKWRCPQWQRCGKWRMIRMMAAITGTQSDAVSAKADKINNPSCDWKGKSLRFTWVTSLRLWSWWICEKQQSGKSLHVPKQGVIVSKNLSVIIYRHKDGDIRLWSWCREPSWNDVN